MRSCNTAKSESAGWHGLLWSRCQLFGIASNAQVVVAHGDEAVAATNLLNGPSASPPQLKSTMQEQMAGGQTN